MPISETNDVIGHIQIAGALDIDDAHTIIKAGADEIVLPLGPRVRTVELSEKGAEEIIGQLDGLISVMVVTYLTDAAEILSLLKRYRLNRVQLQARTRLETLKKLRVLPGIFLVQAICIGETIFCSAWQLAENRSK